MQTNMVYGDNILLSHHPFGIFLIITQENKTTQMGLHHLKLIAAAEKNVKCYSNHQKNPLRIRGAGGTIILPGQHTLPQEPGETSALNRRNLPAAI